MVGLIGDDVTSLVGINEAGKSNVILLFGNCSPVRDGEIDPLHDMPTKEYSSWRSVPEKIVFISADFELDSALVEKVVALCKCDRDAAAIVNIQRLYNGKYIVSFPNYKKGQSVDAATVYGNCLECNCTIRRLERKKQKLKRVLKIKFRLHTRIYFPLYLQKQFSCK